MLSRKTNQSMHNVTKEYKPKDVQYYQRNQTKRCTMLSGKSNQTMYNVKTDFRRHLNVIVFISTLTLNKQGNKDFCPADIAFQTEMVISRPFLIIFA